MTLLLYRISDFFRITGYIDTNIIFKILIYMPGLALGCWLYEGNRSGISIETLIKFNGLKICSITTKLTAISLLWIFVAIILKFR